MDNVERINGNVDRNVGRIEINLQSFANSRVMGAMPSEDSKMDEGIYAINDYASLSQFANRCIEIYRDPSNYGSYGKSAAVSYMCDSNFSSILSNMSIDDLITIAKSKEEIYDKLQPLYYGGDIISYFNKLQEAFINKLAGDLSEEELSNLSRYLNSEEYMARFISTALITVASYKPNLSQAQQDNIVSLFKQLNGDRQDSAIEPKKYQDEGGAWEGADSADALTERYPNLVNRIRDIIAARNAGPQAAAAGVAAMQLDGGRGQEGRGGQGNS